MALYKLSDGTSSVDISPIRGLNIPETRIRKHTENKEGIADDYEWGNAEAYDVPLINITEARADKLLEWWEKMEVLTFTPDQGAPGTTFQMVIDGFERPLNMWHHKFKSKYAGMARLREVSSQSFSSSHVSVSGSKSCSSFPSSQSCSRGPSLSCSVFLVGVSKSRSSGIDIVEVTVSDASCSTGSTSVVSTRSCSTYSLSLPSGWYTNSICSDKYSESTFSSCSDSVSDSRSSSVGTITLSVASQSCSTDPSSLSCSVSPAGESCSVSAGGIS